MVTVRGCRTGTAARPGGARGWWVEQKQPPSRIDASHSTAGKVDRTRPLCA